MYVRRSPGYSNQQHVTVDGEVAFGGQYTITNSTYRLSNLIKDCGGLSEGAYAKGAVLIRRMTEDEKVQQKTLRMAASSGDSVDIRKLDFSTEYNVGINLEMALQNPGSERWDIVLREGDRLFVPLSYILNGEERMCTDTRKFDGAGYYGAIRKHASVNTSQVNRNTAAYETAVYVARLETELAWECRPALVVHHARE